MRLRRIALTLIDAVIVTAVFHAAFRWCERDAGALWTFTAYVGVLSAGLFRLARVEGNDWRMGTFPDLRNVFEATGAVASCVAVVALVCPDLVGPIGLHLLLAWLAGASLLFGARWGGRRLKDLLAPPTCPVVQVRGAESYRGDHPTAWILSLTPVTDEPRVRRQAEALMRAGWSIVVAGYPGRTQRPEGWLLLTLDAQGHRMTRMERLPLAALLPICRWSQWLSEAIYWTMSSYAAIYERLEAALAGREGLRCDLVVANDYFTAPIADRLARAHGVRWCLDAHEVATSQYNDRWTFRALLRPWIHALQHRFLPRAAFVTTICQSIADIIDNDYHLAGPTLVLRSMPNYIEMPFRPCGDAIELLYHGLLAENRGLEQTIASVASWTPGRTLLLRGHGDPDYVEHLNTLIRRRRVDDRVTIVPSVTFNEIIPAANQSDVGYFVQPSFSTQKLYTLPNKFFEYIMAGLALCVADLPEMARVVREEELGWLVATDDPEAIARTVNQVTRAKVDAFKRRAVDAAKRLCWERESTQLIEAAANALRCGRNQIAGA